MHIQELLSVDRITVDTEIGSPTEAIDVLADAFSKADPRLNPCAVADALRARERLCSTNVGSGVAIPHARLADVQGARIAIAICREGLCFDGEGEPSEPVRILVGLLSQEGQPRVSLNALCAVANLLRDDAVREKLRTAQSPDAVMQTLLGAAEAQAQAQSA